MRRSGMVRLALILAIAAAIVHWFGTGGSDKPLSIDDPRVAEAIRFAAASPLNRRIVESGELQKAWLTATESGFAVHLGFQDPSQFRYHFIVSFDESGEPSSMQVDFWRGSTVARYLGLLSASIFGIWLLRTFVAPHFAVKCPDCPPSLLNPPVTVVRDTTVFAGGFDANGDSLPPIVRRDYICPRCHYVKVTYILPGHYRPGRIWQIAFPQSLTSPVLTKDLDRYQAMLDKWRADNEKEARFKAFDDWKAYWDQLKAGEYEGRWSGPV